MTLTKSFACLLIAVFPVLADRQEPPNPTSSRAGGISQYTLGPDDQLKIWALGVEEISDKPVRVDPSGDIDLPILGRIQAAGLTIEQFEDVLKRRLLKEVLHPQVSVELVEFGSQPVSVLGAVNHPGVLQLSGRKTVAEVLSLAGGLRADAGPHVKIARQAKWGKIPLQSAEADASGDFTVATLQVKTLLSATNPVDNIQVRPHDVVTVPTAEMVYIVGAVKKPGSFALNERDSVSVLQALSMAEGLGPTPKPQESKILRMLPGSDQRKEIPVDLKKIMAGKNEDQALRANDILFVPDSTAKKAGARAIEAIIQTATGVAIWGPRF